MSDLRSKIIRLAHERPDLRDTLLPLLVKGAMTSPRYTRLVEAFFQDELINKYDFKVLHKETIWETIQGARSNRNWRHMNPHESGPPEPVEINVKIGWPDKVIHELDVVVPSRLLPEGGSVEGYAEALAEAFEVRNVTARYYEYLLKSEDFFYNEIYAASDDRIDFTDSDFHLTAKVEKAKVVRTGHEKCRLDIILSIDLVVKQLVGTSEAIDYGEPDSDDYDWDR